MSSHVPALVATTAPAGPPPRPPERAAPRAWPRWRVEAPRPTAPPAQPDRTVPRPAPAPDRVDAHPRAAADAADAAGAPPRPDARAAIDDALLEVLAAPPAPGETLAGAFERKERRLGELLGALGVLEARALHRRLARPTDGDLVATRFARLIPERQARLLAFLADAPRRAARALARR